MSAHASTPVSVDGVVDVAVVRGAAAAADAPADLVLEVPHGATRRAHYDALRAQLRGAFPDDLVQFFSVNTDVGAPELALWLARHVVHGAPSRVVTVLRCLLPRTFIDCNRLIDQATVPTTSTAGGMTPGVVSYVKDPADLALLLSRYQAYRSVVEGAVSAVCGAGGTAVMVHSYAPRSVDVDVDDNIVQSLRAAYEPDVFPTWPLRASVDLITTTPTGQLLADPAVVKAVRAAFEAGGLDVTENGTYPLHPSSVAHAFAQRFPGRTLCLELRRDLLVEDFTPFSEMVGDDEKCRAVAALLAQGLLSALKV